MIYGDDDDDEFHFKVALRPFTAYVSTLLTTLYITTADQIRKENSWKVVSACASSK